eukprot:10183548-Alexandrium_andersonii.AAC.1
MLSKKDSLRTTALKRNHVDEPDQADNTTSDSSKVSDADAEQDGSTEAGTSSNEQQPPLPAAETPKDAGNQRNRGGGKREKDEPADEADAVQGE